MDEEIKQAYIDNPTDDAELRQLMVNSFRGIIDFCDEMNYARWLNKRNLPEKIRNYVIRYYNSEDEKRRPGALGFYDRETKQILIRKHSNKFKNRIMHLKYIARHETLHSVSHANKMFDKFIDEGLTEYLNHAIMEYEIQKNPSIRKETLDEKLGSYIEAVSFVSFLYSVFGNALIKNYIQGLSPEFENYALSFLSEDGERDFKSTSDFRTALDIAYTHLYGNQLTGAKISEREKDALERKYRTEALPRLLYLSKNIIINKIREASNNLDFIQNNNNALSFNNEKKESLIDSISALFSTKSALYKNMFGSIDERNLELLRKDAVKRALEIIEPQERLLNDSSLSQSAKKEKLYEMFYKTINKTEANGSINLSRALLKLCKITNTLYKEEGKEKAAIDKFLKSYLPQKANNKALCDFILSDTIVNMLRDLSKRVNESSRLASDSSFVKIRKDLYIEHRDNKDYMFKLTPKGIISAPLIEGRNNTHTLLDFDGKTYNIENLHSSLDKLKIFEGRNDITPSEKVELDSEEDLVCQVFSDKYLGIIEDKLHSNVYVNASTNPKLLKRKHRVIDFDSLIEDLEIFHKISSQEFFNEKLTHYLNTIIKENFYFTAEALGKSDTGKNQILLSMRDSINKILDANCTLDSRISHTSNLETQNALLENNRLQQYNYEEREKRETSSWGGLKGIKAAVTNFRSQQDYNPKH